MGAAGGSNPIPVGLRLLAGLALTAAFSVICVVGAVVMPGILRHGMSLKLWIGLPIIVAGAFVAFAVADRNDDKRIERDLAEWRRRRPHVRPKAR